MTYKKQKSPFFHSHRHFLSCLTNSGLQGRAQICPSCPFEQVAKLSHYPPFSLHKESNILYVNWINYLFNTLCVDAPDGSILTHSRIVPSVEPQTTLERETLQSAKSLNPASKRENPPNPNQIEQPWPKPCKTQTPKGHAARHHRRHPGAPAFNTDMLCCQEGASTQD